MGNLHAVFELLKSSKGLTSFSALATLAGVTPDVFERFVDTLVAVAPLLKERNVELKKVQDLRGIEENKRRREEEVKEAADRLEQDRINELRKIPAWELAARLEKLEAAAKRKDETKS